MSMSLHQLPRPQQVHLADIHTRQPVFSRWERYRHRQAHWLVECLAETMGVFLYVYAGVGSSAGFNIGNLTGQPINSLETVGFAYAIGILLALITCAPTSGGHFNPAVTITLTLFRGFPVRKAVRYIIFQLLGAYIAALLIYAQWHRTIKETEALLIAKGTWDAVNFTPQGLAGIFALYAPAGGNLSQILLNEFVCDFAIGLTIWACMDPTNFLIPPSAGPWIVPLSYTMCIWGFAPVGLSTNAARDLGTRFAVMTIWGKQAAGGTYAAIAALTNIPATICAVLFYEFILTDSSRVITPAHVSVLTGHLAHEEHSGDLKPPTDAGAHEKRHVSDSASGTEDGKPHIETIEQA